MLKYKTFFLCRKVMRSVVCLGFIWPLCFRNEPQSEGTRLHTALPCQNLLLSVWLFL